MKYNVIFFIKGIIIKKALRFKLDIIIEFKII